MPKAKTRRPKLWAKSPADACNAVAFAASLIAGIVKWTQAEGMLDYRTPDQWADRCRLFLLSHPPKVTPRG